MTVNLPPFPTRGGGGVARQLRERREQSAAAAKQLRDELDRLTDQATSAFAVEDERTRTRERLAATAKTSRTNRRRFNS